MSERISADDPIEYARHARDRMIERGITDADVRAVLMHYDDHQAAAYREQASPAEFYVATVRGRRLRVYVARDSSRPFVKSAVWED